MDATTALWMTPTCLVLCYLYYVGHTVVVHNCAHGSLFRRRKRLNWVVGNVICSTQLMHFEGWRIAHMLHHRFANTPNDPHYIDRGMIPYLFTHYLRVAMVLGAPGRLMKSIGPTLLIVAGVVVWQAATGHLLRGIAWVTAFWAIPVIFSQLAVAHFNYATHVGLSQGRGKDTRNLDTGIWRLINRLTFNLYLHAEHHLRPSEAIPRYKPPNLLPLPEAESSEEPAAPAHRKAA